MEGLLPVTPPLSSPNRFSHDPNSNRFSVATCSNHSCFSSLLVLHVNKKKLMFFLEGVGDCWLQETGISSLDWIHNCYAGFINLLLVSWHLFFFLCWYLVLLFASWFLWCKRGMPWLLTSWKMVRKSQTCPLLFTYSATFPLNALFFVWIFSEFGGCWSTCDGGFGQADNCK